MRDEDKITEKEFASTGIIHNLTGRRQIERELKKQHEHLEELVAERTAELQTALAQLQQETAERKLAEEALRLSEERFSKAFKASPNVMCILSITSLFLDARFVDVNESFNTFTRYQREEVIGRTTSELNIWVDPQVFSGLRRMILKQKEIRNIEINFRIKSGKVRTGLLSATIIDFGGKPCILVNVNDITDRKKFEKELARLDRLNLVGEMAAGIGHEIRNPMTTVRGFLQILESKEECAKYRDFYNLMIKELDRANSIITEYLSLAKNKRVEKREKNINNVLEALWPYIQIDAIKQDKNVHVEFGAVPDLLLDEKEIRQLILNLVRNGLEATPPGGNLKIKTFVEGKKVVLSVQDKGKGIRPEVMERLGTPFFTTKDTGTGLGLAICYSIADRHNAEIKVKTGSKGTTFFVFFNPAQTQQQLWPIKYKTIGS